jgi:glutathione synthase/RimK-type ligase-like ATP-grasp enzyme
MKRIAIVTAEEAHGLDKDMPPLLAALAAEGLQGEAVVWDDAAAAWGSYALAVVRSTWDYVSRRDEFVAWAERTASQTRLENPANILRWNTDKRYLRELDARGVRVIRTHWIAPGESADWPFDGDIVVKPAVSAGSLDTERYGSSQRDLAVAHVRRLHAAGRVAMVQPFIASVERRGETGLVYIDGVFSHAVRKGSMLEDGTAVVRDLYREERIEAREATAPERRLAEEALACAPGGLLYARVDVVESPEGPQLLELEATEPSLHLTLSSGSPSRLARAIARRI